MDNPPYTQIGTRPHKDGSSTPAVLCYGCGQSTDLAEEHANPTTRDHYLIPGIGWVCRICARGVYNGTKSSAI